MDPTHHLQIATRRPAPDTQKLALDVLDRNAFAQLLRRSGLLKERQIEHALQQAQSSDRALDVASVLVSAGHLTPFQASELLAGRCMGFILGPYRILDRIDRGGMGNVFRAVHTVMGREVALKAIPVDLIRERRTRLQFRHEIRALARLQHRHIVIAFDANRVRSVFYLAMELVEGPNLERLVREDGPIEPALAWNLMRQAAGALRYAHGQGVIHCDVKPANLLVAYAPGWHGLERVRPEAEKHTAEQLPPYLKILDFGIARVRGLTSGDVHVRHTHAETGIYGTPDYVAPEQAQDLSQADARSDLYSLGCTFYFALTGRVPFKGETTMEKLIQHLTELPQPVEELCPAIPPTLAATIRRLMAKLPNERFQTAAELADALAAAPVLTRPPALKLALSVGEAS